MHITRLAPMLFISLQNIYSQVFTTSWVGRHSLCLPASIQVIMECVRAFKLGDAVRHRQTDPSTSQYTHKATRTATSIDIDVVSSNHRAPTQPRKPHASVDCIQAPHTGSGQGEEFLVYFEAICFHEQGQGGRTIFGRCCCHLPVRSIPTAQTHQVLDTMPARNNFLTPTFM